MRELATWVLHKLSEEVERAKRKLRPSALVDFTALLLFNVTSFLTKTASAFDCFLGFFGNSACQSHALVWLFISQLFNSSLCEKGEVLAVVAEKLTVQFSFSWIC